MINPDRVIVISLMVAIVAAGFTWFAWELFQNIFSLGSYRLYLRRQRALGEEKKRREQAEREVREQLNEQRRA